MDKLTSILVVANRTDADRVVLDKAVFLARKVGAQILLFSCDSVLAKIFQDAYNSEEAERAWHISQAEHMGYLCSLRGAARAADVQISIASECYSPLHEGIINKVREIRPDLVMKTPSGSHPLRRFTFGPSDWHLMRECPAALMLVRQHLWNSPPQFAALVDLSEDDTARLAETIVHTSEHFALGCRGELDVVYSESSADGEQRSSRATALQRLTREYRIPAAHVHVLNGEPEITLPEFAARRRYDALVLGGLTHRKGIAPLVGTLTSKLVEALDSDFILVKREVPDQAEVRIFERSAGVPGTQGSFEKTEHHRSAIDTSVAWHALFGD